MSCMEPFFIEPPKGQLHVLFPKHAVSFRLTSYFVGQAIAPYLNSPCHTFFLIFQTECLNLLSFDIFLLLRKLTIVDQSGFEQSFAERFP